MAHYWHGISIEQPLVHNSAVNFTVQCFYQPASSLFKVHLSETILNTEVDRVEDGLLEPCTIAMERAGSARWSDRRLQSATLRLPDESNINIRPEARQHPVLGLCDSVIVNGRQRTFFTTVDWAEPGFIPAMDAPGTLPSGAGSAIMNLLAHLATKALRYKGPYPTAALFDTLGFAFQHEGEPEKALTTFTANVEALALRGELIENPVRFEPAPCELLAVGGATIVLRRGVERVLVQGRTYVNTVYGTRRLRHEGEDVVAYVDIGGEPWVDILRCTQDGRLIGEVAALPSFEHVLNGEPVPSAMISLVAAVVGEEAPDLLKQKIAEVADSLVWTFGDAGGENVTANEGQIQVHSLLAERLAARSPERFLRYLVEGARPHLLGRAQASLLNDVSGLAG